MERAQCAFNLSTLASLARTVNSAVCDGFHRPTSQVIPCHESCFFWFSERRLLRRRATDRSPSFLFWREESVPSTTFPVDPTFSNASSRLYETRSYWWRIFHPSFWFIKVLIIPRGGRWWGVPLPQKTPYRSNRSVQERER